MDPSTKGEIFEKILESQKRQKACARLVPTRRIPHPGVLVRVLSMEPFNLLYSEFHLGRYLTWFPCVVTLVVLQKISGRLLRETRNGGPSQTMK